MKTEDIIVLARAGFNYKQIAALNSIAGADAKPKTETKPEAPATDQTNEILAALAGLKSDIQNSNINGTSIPGASAPQTADQILAEIINPSKPSDGGVN